MLIIMIMIIPMAHHNSIDRWGTGLELDPTPPRGLWSPTVTGPSQQVHSVLVCFISLLEQNLPETVCCYYYYYYYYYHYYHYYCDDDDDDDDDDDGDHYPPYWALNKDAIKKKNKSKKRKQGKTDPIYTKKQPALS